MLTPKNNSRPVGMNRPKCTTQFSHTPSSIIHHQFPIARYINSTGIDNKLISVNTINLAPLQLCTQFICYSYTQINLQHQKRHMGHYGNRNIRIPKRSFRMYLIFRAVSVCQLATHYSSRLYLTLTYSFGVGWSFIKCAKFEQ